MNNKAPIAARLALDPQLRGKVGIVSEDLANDLFQQQALQGEWEAPLTVLNKNVNRSIFF